MKNPTMHIAGASVLTLTIAVLCLTILPGFVRAAQKPAKELVKIRSMVDKTLSDAIANGMSIVIVPTINMAEKYKGLGSNEILVKAEKEFTADRTFTLNWAREGSSDIALRTGNIRYLFGSLDMKSKNDGAPDSFYQIVEGPILYQVYVVVPGTYDLVGQSAEIHETSAPQAEWNRTYRGSTIGTLSLKEGKSPKYYRAVEWQNATIDTKERRGTFCTSVFVVSGNCAYWEKKSWQESYVSRPAGYYNALKSEPVDSVIVEHRLTRPFASFSVATGEAILIDGLFAEYPNSNFPVGDCSRTQPDSVLCPLTGYTLAKLYGAEEGFRKIDYSGELVPKFEKIAAKVVYRPLKMYATEGGQNSRWGPSYTMVAGEN